MQKTNRRSVRWRWLLMIIMTAVLIGLSVSGVIAKEMKKPLDINTASQQDLEALKGVGPSAAKKIIEHRPYKSVDELSKAGISAKNIDALKPFVAVGPAAAATQSAKTSATSEKAAGDAVRPAAKSTAVKSPIELVDLNTADQKSLEALPGVGPKTAQEIIKARPLKSADDLGRVKGITKGTMDKLRGLVTVSTAKPIQSSVPTATPAAPSPSTAAKAAPVSKTATASEKSAAATKLAPGEKVNINTASKEKIEALPGIGSVKAQAIIDARPYEKVEDIMKVKGIKEGSFNKIKDLISVK